MRSPMTTKQRLACGAAILRSIDTRRRRIGTRTEFLALEQAIVDRELMELVAGELCDETCELKRGRLRKENLTRSARSGNQLGRRRQHRRPPNVSPQPPRRRRERVRNDITEGKPMNRIERSGKSDEHADGPGRAGAAISTRGGALIVLAQSVCRSA